MILMSIIQVSANTYAQKVTINKINAPLKVVIDEICKQGGYDFVLDANLKKHLKPVTINVKESSVENALNICLKDQPLTYTIEDRLVVLKVKKTTPAEVVIKDIAITGRVSDEQNKTIPGVTVRIQNTQTAVSTKDDGTFRIMVPDEKTVLVFSFIGYESQTVVVGNRSEINIILKQQNSRLNEVMVIGYGTQSKERISSSISKVSASDMKDAPVTNAMQAIVGKAPGVQVSANNGAPGGGLSVKVRGISTMTSGNQPLYVIDGVPISSAANNKSSQQGSSTYNGYTVDPLSSLNPNDIESIEILKDAAAAAIYGSRGSNGVVLITTKSGKNGDAPKVSFDAYTGFQQLAKKIQVADAYEFANFSKIARDNLWVFMNPATNKATDPNDSRTSPNARYASYLIPYINGQQGLPSTDWQNEVYRKALTQNYQFSVSGGGNKSRYYISTDYLDQDGIIQNSGIKRYSTKVNYQVDINKIISFGTNINLSYANNNLVQSEGSWGNEGVVISTLMYAPNLPVRNPDGSLALGGMLKPSLSGQSAVALIENPLALAEDINNKLYQLSALGSAYLTFRLSDDLKFKTFIGTNLNSYKHNYYRPKYLNYQTQLAPTTSANLGWENSYMGTNWISENSLTYSKTFNNKHSLDILLDYSIQRDNNQSNYSQGINFASDQVHTINTAQTTSATSDASISSLISYIGRVSYAYENKYLITASLRRDGSSRFGINSKYGLFPSASLGWKISDEDFFPKSQVLSNLKLRASYGVTGNNEIPNYGSQALLGVNNYVIGNSVVNGVAQSTSPNPNLSWEKTRMFNAGFDMSLLNRSIDITADYFISRTDDLLLNVTVPSSSGVSSSLQNIGKMENRGFEFGINGNFKIGQVSWYPSFNFSTTTNKVLSLAPNQSQFLSSGSLPGDSYITKVGSPIGSYYGYKVIGIFQNQQQLDSYPHLSNNKVGDFKYEDTDHNGVLNANDRTILGNYLPKYNLNFSNNMRYKNVDFAFTIQSSLKFSVLNAQNRYLFEGWGNVYKSVATGSWISESNPGNGTDPRPVWGIGSNDHTTLSSFQIEDASFVRIRNLTLGYSFADKLLKRASIQHLRIYVSAVNPFTFTKYKGYNPEVSNGGNSAIQSGEDFGNYPIAKSFVIGANLSL